MLTVFRQRRRCRNICFYFMEYHTRRSEFCTLNFCLSIHYPNLNGFCCLKKGLEFDYFTNQSAVFAIQIKVPCLL